MAVKVKLGNKKLYFKEKKCYTMIVKSKRGFNMNELDSLDGFYLSPNIEKGQLVKSKNFLFTNLSKRMTSTQNILFSLALLHAEVRKNEYGEFASATFRKEDIERFIKDLKYSEGRKSRILVDIEKVGTNSILLYDEKMMTDPDNGKATGVLVFASYSYDAGEYRFSFNTSKIMLDGKMVTPILDILKREEVNPIVYNLDIFANLNVSAQVLYEQILLATNNEKRCLSYSLEQLRGLFGATGKTMERFNGIKNTHLIPAIEKINNKADIDVTFEVVKRSRKVVGVDIYWTLNKVKIPPTDKQISKAHELFIELSMLSADNVELLTRLREIEQNETKFTARSLIEDAIAYKRQIEHKDNAEVQAVQKTIEYKREEETKRAEMIEEEKAAKRSELPKFETIPPLDPEAIQKRNMLEKQLMSYFKRISETNKMNILDLVCVYEDAEEMLQFARQIYKENNGQSMGYVIKVLRNWQKNNVQNLTDAKQFQKTNFGTKDKSSNKKSEKKKGNDPSWSNPDYKNMTSEEKKAEMAVKKQEMLARLDESAKK